MKKLFYPLFIGTIAVLFASCDHDSPEKPEPMVEIQLAIIKLSPEMKEQVFVSPIVDSVLVDYTNSNADLRSLYYGDGLALCNLNPWDTILSVFAESKLKILGTTPYIMLDNGDAIIDWKWAYFQPLSGLFILSRYRSLSVELDKYGERGYSTDPYYVIANEEYYLLPIKWPELSGLTATWDISEGQKIGKPKIRHIKLADIEKYGEFASGYKELTQKYNVVLSDFSSIHNLFTQNPELFENFVEEYNHLQAAYVETLNQMIKNSDF